MPDWAEFTAAVARMFQVVRDTERGGRNADYIAALSEQVSLWSWCQCRVHALAAWHVRG